MRNGARPLEIPPEAIQKLRITSRLREVQFPRKFRPREDFPSNRSSELENPNRAGEIYRAEIEFGWRSLQDFVIS